MSSLVDSASATDEPVPCRPVDHSAHTVVYAHVEPGTTVSYRMYPDENRVTLDIGHGAGEVLLFLKQDGIFQMIYALEEALMELSRAVYELRGPGGE